MHVTSEKFVVYRIAETKNKYKKDKPEWINNRDCLYNAINHFRDWKFIILADGVEADTMEWLAEIRCEVRAIEAGSGAASFRKALEVVGELPDDSIVYMLEDDYMHKNGAEIALEALELPDVDYVTLYDHPDKYSLEMYDNLLSKIYVTDQRHWRTVPSTTMTAMAYKETWLEDKETWHKWTEGTHPHDHQAWMDLTIYGGGQRILVSPIPTLSTHGETQWIAPLWE